MWLTFGGWQIVKTFSGAKNKLALCVRAQEKKKNFTWISSVQALSQLFTICLYDEYSYY